MKTAKASDWKTKPLPSIHTTVNLGRTFSIEEMDCIRRGFIPEEMEDKWFIYWQDDTLFFHRSWTGFCIYVAHFQCTNGEWRVIGAEVNADPEQHHLSSDRLEPKLIDYLIDLLLLRRDASFPSDSRSPGESAIQAWSLVGRAMLGQFPDDYADVEDAPEA